MGAQAQLPPLGPEDSVELFDCLKQSLSQDTLVQKSAEAALGQYERRPNFCACLAVSEPNAWHAPTKTHHSQLSYGMTAGNSKTQAG